MNIDSKSRVTIFFKNATLGVVIAVMVGCGGGGGHNGSSATSPGTVNNGGGGNAGHAGINGDLTGAIYYDDYGGRHSKLDLATGVVTTNPISAEHWDAFYKDVQEYDIDEANKRFVLARLWGNDRIQIYSVDKNYNLVDNFLYEGYAVHSFHVSPNGKYISMISASGDARADYFTVFDTSGKVLYEIECGACNDHEWIQDSSGILLSVADSIHLIDFKDFDENKKINVSQIRDLSKEGLYPFSLSISPDGKILAFRAITGTGSRMEDAHIFVINVDGTGLRQLTDGSSEGEWDVSWAKNGNGLFVVVGEHDYVEVNCHRELFWVNENSDKVILSDSADPTMTKPIKKYNSHDGVYDSLDDVCLVNELKQPWEL